MGEDRTKAKETSDSGGEHHGEEEEESFRQRGEEGLERFVPEVIKRTLEAGWDTLSRTDRGRLRGLVNELRIPRELAHYLLVQVDDTKNALLRVFANEVRDFLENTDLTEDLRKVLTSVSLEVSTQIRFIPNDAGNTTSKPVVDSQTQTPDKRGSKKAAKGS